MRTIYAAQNRIEYIIDFLRERTEAGTILYEKSKIRYKKLLEGLHEATELLCHVLGEDLLAYEPGPDDDEFSDPYVDNAQVIVVRGDSPVQTIADLEGATVGVQAGSSAQDAINDTSGFVDTIGEVIEFKENLTALMDLEIGGCDAVVMDLLVANDNINRSGSDFRILDETLVKEEYAIGFRLKDVALRDAVQRELNAMAADGTLAEIATKWFGADITVVGK